MPEEVASEGGVSWEGMNPVINWYDDHERVQQQSDPMVGNLVTPWVWLILPLSNAEMTRVYRVGKFWISAHHLNIKWCCEDPLDTTLYCCCCREQSLQTHEPQDFFTDRGLSNYWAGNKQATFLDPQSRRNATVSSCDSLSDKKKPSLVYRYLPAFVII